MKDLLKIIKQIETPFITLSFFYGLPLFLILFSIFLFINGTGTFPLTTMLLLVFSSFGSIFYLFISELISSSTPQNLKSQQSEQNTPSAEPSISREKQIQILEENQQLQKELDDTLSQSREHLNLKNKALEDLKLATYQFQEKEKALAIQIADLSENTEMQQKEILKLKQQLEDTNFELTTLIQLNDNPTSFNFENTASEDPLDSHIEKAIEDIEVNQLINAESDIAIAQALEIAIEMTAANHLSKSNATLFSSSHYAIDIRKFSDLLHSEITFPAFLYSPEESKFIFVTRPIRSITEWPADAFLNQLNEKLLDKNRSFSNQLHEIQSKGKGSIEIDFITKSGDSIQLALKMQKISEGVFVNHLVGVILKQSKIENKKSNTQEPQEIGNPST